MNKKMLNWSFLCLLLSAFMTGCQTVPSDQVFPGALYGISLKELCRANNIDMEWDEISQVITLRKDGSHVTALMDSPIILLNDEQFVLNEPVRRENGSIVVTHEFQSQILSRMGGTPVQPMDFAAAPANTYVEPVVTRAPIKSNIKKPVQQAREPKRKRRGSYKIASIREIIIDAGHGGKDPGAIGRSGLREKEVVLDISRRVKKRLEAEGIKVHLTRHGDNFKSLQERTAFASGTKADVFVSIHANASKRRSASGIEVFSLRHLNNAEMQDEKRRGNRNILMSNLSSKKDSKVGGIVDELLFENKQAESIQLAQKLTKDLSKSLKARNRGTKKAGFYVLRNTFIPAVLIEVGFLSNPKEERLLKTSKYREKIAKSIANSLLDYNK